MTAGAPADKEALLARIRDSRATLERLIAPLSGEQLAAPGPGGGWSIKDHLYHLATWQQVQLARMQRRPPWAVVDLDEAAFQAAADPATDFREINALIERRGKDLPPEAVLALFRDSFAHILAELERWSYDELLQPVRPDGPTTLQQLSGDSYEHDDEHRRMLERVITAG
jgi:hypothetical protein